MTTIDRGGDGSNPELIVADHIIAHIAADQASRPDIPREDRDFSVEGDEGAGVTGNNILRDQIIALTTANGGEILTTLEGDEVITSLAISLKVGRAVGKIKDDDRISPFRTLEGLD
ncbi:hypothetical protein VB777_03380 [Synechococcus sp. CCY9202]|nr:hypothetical protein [Synechococcus sp. CCY9202]